MQRIPPPKHSTRPHPTRLALTLIVLALAWLTAAPVSADRRHGMQPTKKVKVINSAEMPVPVVEVGMPQREPFQDETQIQVTGFLHDPLFTVPLGRRAVIETVSVLVTFPTSQGVGGFLSVDTSVEGDQAQHFLVLTTQGTVLTSEARTANHAVRLYADPGTEIFLGGAIQAGSTIFVSLSGYLEEVP